MTIVNYDSIVSSGVVSSSSIVLNGDTSDQSALRYAPKFNGANTYMDLSVDVVMSAGEQISISFIAPSSALSSEQFLLSRSSWSNIAYVKFLADGSIESASAGDVLIDGVVASVYPTDGDKHELIYIAPSQKTLNRIGASPAGLNTELVMYNLALPSGEVFALDEPYASYPAITGSLGSSAIAYNFTESDIIEINN